MFIIVWCPPAVAQGVGRGKRVKPKGVLHAEREMLSANLGRGKRSRASNLKLAGIDEENDDDLLMTESDMVS
eukprot:590571-Prorocentrum_minimum.AAC.1